MNRTFLNGHIHHDWVYLRLEDGLPELIAVRLLQMQETKPMSCCINIARCRCCPCKGAPLLPPLNPLHPLPSCFDNTQEGLRIALRLSFSLTPLNLSHVFLPSDTRAGRSHFPSHYHYYCGECTLVCTASNVLQRTSRGENCTD